MKGKKLQFLLKRKNKDNIKKEFVNTCGKLIFAVGKGMHGAANPFILSSVFTICPFSRTPFFKKKENY